MDSMREYVHARVCECLNDDTDTYEELKIGIDLECRMSGSSQQFHEIF